MNLNTYSSVMFDTKILANGIIQIPELQKWENKDIHIVIVFKEDKKDEKKNSKSLGGKLKKYSNPSLIENETEIAWSQIKDN
jgi:hypothetical protein